MSPEEYRRRFPGLDPVWIVRAVTTMAAAGDKSASAAAKASEEQEQPVAVTDDESPRDEPNSDVAADSSTKVSRKRTEGPSWRSEAASGIPATRLGDYELLEKLGAGGMGTLYKALHTRLDRVVALKVLSADRMQDEQAVARFAREMKLVGKLDHRNIVRATDARESDGLHYMVMDLVDGTSLSGLVSCLGPLPIADACELVRQAAMGLQYAHERDIVHRDIKPSNMMLSSDGELKILDFGLAHLRTGLVGYELTRADQLLGTLDYLAPEQAGDSHAVDRRVDIYALGCTLYKLLTGEAPFTGEKFDTPVKKIMAHAAAPVPPLGERRPDTPERLVPVVQRMLAKSPDDRFATAADVAQALLPFTSGCDLPGLVKAALRSRGAPQSTADLPVVALGGELPFQRPEPRINQQKPRYYMVAVAVLLALVALASGIWAALGIPGLSGPDKSVLLEALQLEITVGRGAGDAPMSLDAAVPVRSQEDDVQIVCELPKGFHGSLFWLDTEGRLNALATEQENNATATVLYWPRRGKANVLDGPPGTEVIFVCASRSGLPQAEEVQPLVADASPWPKLPPSAVLEFDQGEARIRSPRGPGSGMRDRPDGAVIRRADSFRRALADRFELVRGVAFAHEER